MNTAGQVSDPTAVAWWLDTLMNPQGCMRLAPDPADPLAVAAYNEARRCIDCGGLNVHRLEITPDDPEPQA